MTAHPTMTFDEVFRAAYPHLVLDQARAKSLYQSAMETAHVPGALAELGVYRGGASLLMALACPHKRIYLFDTFAGLPEPAAIDVHRRGEFACDVDQVRAVMQVRNYEIIAGTFPASVSADFHETFSLVHLDADLYESTRDGLAFFWPRLEVGGRIVLDDWQWSNCPGVAKSVEEFSRDLFNKGEGHREKLWESAPFQLTIEKDL